MTTKELIEKLQLLDPEGTKQVTAGSNDDEFYNGFINYASVTKWYDQSLVVYLNHDE